MCVWSVVCGCGSHGGVGSDDMWATTARRGRPPPLGNGRGCPGPECRVEFEPPRFFSYTRSRIRGMHRAVTVVSATMAMANAHAKHAVSGLPFPVHPRLSADRKCSVVPDAGRFTAHGRACILATRGSEWSRNDGAEACVAHFELWAHGLQPSRLLSGAAAT